MVGWGFGPNFPVAGPKPRPTVCSKETVMSDEMRPQSKPRHFLLDLLQRLFKERPLGAACAGVILVLAVIGILADVIAPFSYFKMHLIDRLTGPSATYLLGTDQLGREVMSRLLHGARTSLGIGFAATLLSTLVALVIGGVAGFVGGKLDIFLQRVVDAWMAFPGLLLLLTIMSIVGQGILQIIVVLGVTSGIGNSRVVRSAVIAIKENTYFEAARATGSTPWHILMRHVLPNITAPVIVVFSITIGGVIIAEASLSFLGFGLPTTVPSWGGMLSREGRQFMEMAPRLAMWPGICLTVVVYCLNIFGDAMRDLLDPRLRGGQGSYGVAGKRKRGILARLVNPFS